MLDHIWLFMIILSFACALMTGRMEQLTLAVNDGAGKAVKVLIEMAGSICLWSGLMAIADKSGISDRIAKLLSPALRLIMPELRPGSPALRAVSANVTANILGLGNAATPLGILAMKEMKKTSLLHDSPDNSMVMFVVINTASLQLIPVTAAALRSAAGSSDPYGILPMVWISSAAALTAGIGMALILGAVSKIRSRRKRVMLYG